MAQFIVTYTIGDGCTWSSEIVRPVDAESEEEIYVRLCELREEKMRLEAAHREASRAFQKLKTDEARDAYMLTVDALRDMNKDVNGTSFESWVDFEATRDGALDEVEILPLQDWFQREKIQG